MTESVVSNSVPRRTKRLIDQLLASRQLSKTGLDWLIRATDPFYDFELKPQGYPDNLSSKVVVQELLLTQTITVPAGRDMHLFFLPHTTSFATGGAVAALQAQNLYNNGAAAPGATGSASLVGGLNAVLTASGSDWTTNAAATQVGTTIGLPQAFSGGQTRLIGCGWEAVNITPAINQGGSITAYRNPCAMVDSFILPEITSPSGYAFTPLKMGSLPPGTQADAALYPNSRTWQASEGIYQVLAMNSIEQPFVNPVPGLVGYMQPPTVAQLTANAPRLSYLPAQALVVPWSGNRYTHCSHPLNFDISGSVITTPGFDQTYQITVRYMIERIPTTTDQTLLVLAHEPAPYDPLAIEIYSHAMSRLPVACRVDENPLGEWFEQVMDVVSTALPAVGKAVSVVFPPASLIGDVLGTGAKMASNWNREARLASEAELAARAAQSAADKAKNQAAAQQTTKKLPPIQNKTIRMQGPVTVNANGAQNVGYRRKKR